VGVSGHDVHPVLWRRQTRVKTTGAPLVSWKHDRDDFSSAISTLLF
jgi:hypothetical protein